MANPFVHIELNTSDLGKARTFYGELLDWELKDVDMGPGGTYTTIGVGEGTGGGMMKHPMEGAPSLWIPYISVKDSAVSTAKARTLERFRDLPIRNWDSQTRRTVIRFAS